MAAKVRTRHASDTKLTGYIGVGKELIGSELPTLRSVLRQGLHFQEEKVWQDNSHPNTTMHSVYTVQELSVKMTQALTAQWRRANVAFHPPVTITDNSIERKLKLAWETAMKIASRKITKKVQVEAFENKLDKLVDITWCRCKITSCEELDCSKSCKKCSPCGRCGDCKKCKDCIECCQGAHIDCTCVKEVKLPLLELKFLDTQRQKIGEQGSMMISGTKDMVEQVKQVKKLSRKEQVQSRVDEKTAKEQRESQELDERSAREEELCQPDIEENIRVVEDDTLGISDFLKKRNTVEVTCLASTAIRYSASSRMAAALATAYLSDLVKAGVLPEDAVYLAVDGAKVQRAKDNMMEMASERGLEKAENDIIEMVMFDSRIDKKTRIITLIKKQRNFIL